MRISNDTDHDNAYHISHKHELVYSLMLIASAVATEIHSFLAAKFPELTKGEGIKKDLFLSPSFKMDIDILWYIKMIFDNLFLLVILFVGSLISYHISKKLFYVFTIFLMYNIIDFFSFCWNFKTTTGMYWVFLSFVAMAVLMIIFKRNGMRAV